MSSTKVWSNTWHLHNWTSFYHELLHPWDRLLSQNDFVIKPISCQNDRASRLVYKLYYEWKYGGTRFPCQRTSHGTMPEHPPCEEVVLSTLREILFLIDIQYDILSSKATAFSLQNRYNIIHNRMPCFGTLDIPCESMLKLRCCISRVGLFEYSLRPP